jgi:hypothetical protein
MLQGDESLTAYCDLFGVSSIEEIAGRIIKSIDSITQKKENLFNKAIKLLISFRPVLSPRADGGISISVIPASKSAGLDLLDETPESLGKFIEDVTVPVHFVPDEFQEITEVDHSIGVEGTLRQHIQKIQCTFVFIGSRRRILLDMFNSPKRPFFQSAINYELTVLPTKELSAFIVRRFKEAGKQIETQTVLEVCTLLKEHPYYVQKFCFFYSTALKKKSHRTIFLRPTNWLWKAKRHFLNPFTATDSQKNRPAVNHRQGTCKKLYSTDYMARHRLKSTGGGQNGIDVLTKEDLIEKRQPTGLW